jgi:hypothetical protein
LFDHQSVTATNNSGGGHFFKNTFTFLRRHWKI